MIIKRTDRRCYFCKERKPLSEFGKHRSANQGNSYLCKSCNRERNQKFYYKDQEKYIRLKREYEAKHKGTEKFKLKHKKRWLQVKNSPILYGHAKANAKLCHEVKMGRMKREPCERCGEVKTEGHHHKGYDKPLEVMWLCVRHHHSIHHELRLNDI